MEDERIIDLYWQRSQEAISRTDEKYGRLCTKISLNILSNAQDAEECVSDTYMALWNSIPPQRPTCFQAFAAAIVRNLSLMKLREQYARKRGGGEFDLVQFIYACFLNRSSSKGDLFSSCVAIASLKV